MKISITELSDACRALVTVGSVTDEDITARSHSCQGLAAMETRGLALVDTSLNYSGTWSHMPSCVILQSH